ncbi:XAC0095 family protein [Pseudoxanthomonas beigongshangi]
MQARGTPEDDAGYHLPEEAQLQLQQVRDQLEMMAAMVMPGQRSDDARDALCLQPSALAHCFRQLAREMSEALAATRWRG